MRVKTETNEIGTHYEFICYYENKRVALLSDTLDMLLNSNAVKLLAWFVNENFEYVTEAYNVIVNKYDISEQNKEQLINDLTDYNNGEFDTPYKVELVNVTREGSILERLSFELDYTDIKEIIYRDYSDILPDKLLEKLLCEMSDLIEPDTCYVFDTAVTYNLAGIWNDITFKTLDYYSGTVGGHIRACIIEILMTEDIYKVLDVSFYAQEEVIYLDTDKGQLIICLEGED